VKKEYLDVKGNPLSLTSTLCSSGGPSRCDDSIHGICPHFGQRNEDRSRVHCLLVGTWIIPRALCRGPLATLEKEHEKAA